MKPFCLLLSLLLCCSLQAQQRLTIDLTRSCSYYGMPVEDVIYGFESSMEALTAVDNILRHVGLKRNFEVRAANVPNAAAVISNDKRYILYSQSFISMINSTTGSRWSAISILAHEIGHHLNGHTLERTGSRPPIELEADEWSGFILAKMGATLREAQLAMSTIASPQGSSTHPGRSARLEAIAVGWNKARELEGRTGTPTTQQPKYIFRCSFTGDGYQYFVTDTDIIVAINPQNNNAVVIGQKQVSNDTRFAWFYTTPSVQYGVDHYGNIWGRNVYGFYMRVGVATKI